MKVIPKAEKSPSVPLETIRPGQTFRFSQNGFVWMRLNMDSINPGDGSVFYASLELGYVDRERPDMRVFPCDYEAVET